MTSERVPVLIVGGGAAGLTMSIALSRRGVKSLVVERREGTSQLPKAHILNQRTMEIFTEIGISDEVYAQGSPHEWMSRTAWVTSLAGSRAEHGRTIGWTNTWGGGDQLAAHLAASPNRTTNLPQRSLEPILRHFAQELAPGRVRFEHELVDFTQDDDGVTATVRNSTSGETYEVRSEYLVAADGGRTVAGLLGIPYDGERGMVKMVSSFVRIDLSSVDVDPRMSMYWFVSPDAGGSIGSGILTKMGGVDWGPRADEWVYHFSTDVDDTHEYTPDEVIPRFHHSIGTDQVPIEVQRISTWVLESVIARKFSDGRVFLVGDAAHRHPPTGGLGLNTAVADVHNLAWKLVAVLNRDAGTRLLESYGAERRPVAMRNAEQSLKSFFQHSEIDDALRIDADTTPDEGWARIRALFSTGPEAEAMRAAVDDAVRHKRDEFCAQNLEIGYDYLEGAVISDGLKPPTPPDPVCGFIAGTWPGHRMPHARIQRAGRSCSTFDLARQGQFVLLLGSDDAAWRQAAQAVATHLGFDLVIASIGPDGNYTDPTGAWREQREVSDSGAVLIRPDQHVAWRSADAVADPERTLSSVFEFLLGRAGDMAGRDPSIVLEQEAV